MRGDHPRYGARELSGHGSGAGQVERQSPTVVLLAQKVLGKGQVDTIDAIRGPPAQAGREPRDIDYNRPRHPTALGSGNPTNPIISLNQVIAS
jgi:hypothetical protein